MSKMNKKRAILLSSTIVMYLMGFGYAHAETKPQVSPSGIAVQAATDDSTDTTTKTPATVDQIYQIKAGDGITITDGDVNDSGQTTKTIAVKADGSLTKGNTGLLTGGTLWSTLNRGRQLSWTSETGYYIEPSSIGKNSYAIAGNRNTASGNESMIFNGVDNIVSGDNSVIISGENNSVTFLYSAVLSGHSNAVSGKWSSALGGYANKVKGNWSTVIGGGNNEANEINSVAGGGQYNKASGKSSVAIGGDSNEASGTAAVMDFDCTTVVGGRYNYVYGHYTSGFGGYSNGAYGESSVVSGGRSNRAFGKTSSVYGGRNGYVFGESSTGLAGGSTTSDAENGVALGYQSIVSVASGTAVGTQATADEAGTISFGHDKGDISSLQYKWKKTSDNKDDYSKTPDVTTNTYDSAYYNRLVKVADGIDDHDVATVGQLKTMIADVSGSSNIEYTYGSGLTITDKGANDSGKAVKEIDLNHSMYTNLGDVDNYGTTLTINNSGENSFIIGGTYKTLWESINRPLGNEGDYSIILSGTNNSITSDGKNAVAIGGYFNTIRSTNSVISGGINHYADGAYSVISGGQGNKTSGQYSSIFGGQTSKTQGEWASILGGQSNEASGEAATVVGGSNNFANGERSVVVGGIGNRANGDYLSTVVGGSGNRNYGSYSVILSGCNNGIYSSMYSAAIAGSENAIYGTYSVVASGVNNTTYGDYSGVFGGYDSRALNNFSSSFGSASSTICGSDSVSLGGQNSIVLGSFSTAVSGGSIGSNISYATAIGNKSLTTKENGLALGYQAVQNTDGTISFGHDAGDVSGYELSWEKKTIEDKYKDDYAYTRDTNDYSKSPTVTETTYDTAYYNRLVKVADGIDDHDVTTVGQVKKLVADSGYTGNEDVIISDDHVISVSKTGQISANNSGLVTGDTVYQVTNKLATNITEQQTALNATKSRLDTMSTSIENIRKNVTDINNTVAGTIADLSGTMGTFVNKDLSNISDDGRMVLKDLIKAELKSQNGASTSSTSTTKQISMSLSPVVTMSMVDALDTNDSDKATVENNTKETANSVVDQSYVDSALSQKADKATVDALTTTVENNTKNITANTEAIKVNAKDISDLKENKANKDGSNIDVSSWSEKLGTGNVAKDDKGLVTGDTVFNALEKKADLDYVSSGFAGLQNQMQLMNQNLTKDINNGVAAASALAALKPLDYDSSDKFNFAVGYGHYKNANSTALGAFYYANADTMFNIGATIGNGTPALNAGLSFKLGKGSSYAGVSKADLVKDNLTLHQEVAQQTQTILDQQGMIDKQSEQLDKQNQKINDQDKKIAELEKMVKDLASKVNR